MTDINALIADLREKHAETTQGEWGTCNPREVRTKSYGRFIGRLISTTDIKGILGCTAPDGYDIDDEVKNAACICADHNAVPVLIAEIERLQQENEHLGSAIEAHIQAAAVEIVNKIFEDKNVGAVSLGITCPHCNATFGDVNEAIAHDATCPKHPAVIRAEQLADAAEFEARVAAKMAKTHWRTKPCGMGKCARSLDFNCPYAAMIANDSLPFCNLYFARISVEEEMEEEGK